MSPAHFDVSDKATELVLSAPPVAVTTAYFAGISVQDWAAILTIIYVFLLIIAHVYREIRSLKAGKNPSSKKEGQDDT